MSEIQKCPNLVRGGGQHFSKMSQIQKCPKGGRGGSTLIGTLSQIFSIFYFDASPWNIYGGKRDTIAAPYQTMRSVTPYMFNVYVMYCISLAGID